MKEIYRKLAILGLAANPKPIPIIETKSKELIELFSKKELTPRETAELINAMKAKQIRKDKKVEAFLICPLCGQHKKVYKAVGVGYAERLLKLKRNSLLKKLHEEDPKVPEELFSIREKQEWLEKYHQITELAEKFGNEIQSIIQRDFSTLAVSDKEWRERIYEFLIEEKGEDSFIFRQPFLDVDTEKILSFRINFGNPRAGTQKKYLMVLRGLARIDEIRNVLSAWEIIEYLFKNIPEDERKSIIQRLTEELVREPISQTGVTPEEITGVLQEEVQKEQEEGGGFTFKPLSEEEGFEGVPSGGFGDFGEVTSKLLEELKKLLKEQGFELQDIIEEETGSPAVVINILFPLIEKLIEQKKELRGFVELDYLTYDEFAKIYNIIKNSDFKKLQAAGKIIVKMFGIPDFFATEEDIKNLIVFACYIKLQLDRVAGFCEKYLKKYRELFLNRSE